MRQQVETGGAPAAIGPYSQGIRAGSLVYTAGQLRNVTAILDAAGVSLDRVVKTTVFLADMADFTAMNEVYARHFSAPFPARSTFAVNCKSCGLSRSVEPREARGCMLSCRWNRARTGMR